MRTIDEWSVFVTSLRLMRESLSLSSASKSWLRLSCPAAAVVVYFLLMPRVFVEWEITVRKKRSTSFF